MKKKNMKMGIAGLILGSLLLALSMYSSSIIMRADSATPTMSEGFGLVKVIMWVAVAIVAISIFFFVRSFGSDQ